MLARAHRDDLSIVLASIRIVLDYFGKVLNTVYLEHHVAATERSACRSNVEAGGSTTMHTSVHKAHGDCGTCTWSQ